jgi:RNA-binding protein NOB1
MDGAASSASAGEAPYRHLVLDTNVFVTGSATLLRNLATRYWTIPEVLAEVRDEHARAALATLPFKLDVRVPSEASVEAVRAFAAKTGDLASISTTDLRLVALTHMLEREENGDRFIRSEPPSATTGLGKPVSVGGERWSAPASLSASTPLSTPTPCRFFPLERGCRLGDECRFAHVLPQQQGEGAAAAAAAGAAAAAPASSEASAAPAAAAAAAAPGHGSGEAGVAAGAEAAAAADEDDDDDSDGEWIGPTGPEPEVTSSLPSSIPGGGDGGAGGGGGGGPARRLAACVTTDFAMQNTLLQMGLLLATHSGKVVDCVKQWVLKCDACFSIWPISPTRPDHNLFCKKCGNATLARLGVTLGADGTPRYHYKRFRQINTRGTIYTIPAPKGGRDRLKGGPGDGAELLLRPDQLLTGGWREKARHAKAASQRETLLDARTVDDVLSAPAGPGGGMGGGWIGPGANAAAAGSAWMEVGWGKRNPNSVRTHHRGHKK